MFCNYLIYEYTKNKLSKSRYYWRWFCWNCFSKKIIKTRSTSGALAEIKKGILPKDYPDLDTRAVQINIIQSSDCILKGMSAKASQKAEDFLEKLGVQVWKNVRVTKYRFNF